MTPAYRTKLPASTRQAHVAASLPGGGAGGSARPVAAAAAQPERDPGRGRRQDHLPAHEPPLRPGEDLDSPVVVQGLGRSLQWRAVVVWVTPLIAMAKPLEQNSPVYLASAVEHEHGLRIPAIAEILKPDHRPWAACVQIAAVAALICFRLYLRCWMLTEMPRREPSRMTAVRNGVRGPCHITVIAL
jgi:hypothetical protein